jgi:uncharacterized alkaline shock family protein YloU
VSTLVSSKTSTEVTGTAGGPPATRDERDELEQPRHRGKTFISDEVVSVIARLAAEQVEGIHQIGLSSFRSMLSRFGRHRGVESEVGLKEAAIDIDVTVIFGYPIRELAQELREVIIDSVERMTGRQVVEVNINVNDVHVPGREQRTRRQLE